MSPTPIPIISPPSISPGENASNQQIQPAQSPQPPLKWALDKTQAKVLVKPRRPYTPYNIFYLLERELMVQDEPLDGEKKRLLEKENGKMSPSGEKEVNPEDELELPARYKNVVLAPSWYESTGKEKRKHRKTHGKVTFQELTQIISTNWSNVDEETKTYCTQLSEMARRKYKDAMNKYIASQKILQLKKEQAEMIAARAKREGQFHTGKKGQAEATGGNGHSVQNGQIEGKGQKDRNDVRSPSFSPRSSPARSKDKAETHTAVTPDRTESNSNHHVPVVTPPSIGSLAMRPGRDGYRPFPVGHVHSSHSSPMHGPLSSASMVPPPLPPSSVPSSVPPPLPTSTVPPPHPMLHPTVPPPHPSLKPTAHPSVPPPHPLLLPPLSQAPVSYCGRHHVHHTHNSYQHSYHHNYRGHYQHGHHAHHAQQHVMKHHYPSHPNQVHHQPHQPSTHVSNPTSNPSRSHGREKQHHYYSPHHGHGVGPHPGYDRHDHCERHSIHERHERHESYQKEESLERRHHHVLKRNERHERTHHSYNESHLEIPEMREVHERHDIDLHRREHHLHEVHKRGGHDKYCERHHERHEKRDVHERHGGYNVHDRRGRHERSGIREKQHDHRNERHSEHHISGRDGRAYSPNHANSPSRREELLTPSTRENYERNMSYHRHHCCHDQPPHYSSHSSPSETSPPSRKQKKYHESPGSSSYGRNHHYCDNRREEFYPPLPHLNSMTHDDAMRVASLMGNTTSNDHNDHNEHNYGKRQHYEDDVSYNNSNASMNDARDARDMRDVVGDDVDNSHIDSSSREDNVYDLIQCDFLPGEHDEL